MNEIVSKLDLRRQTDRSPALREYGWYHSFEFPDGTYIRGVQSLEQLRERWARFPIPADLTSKRVLDIGAWDGWFSFEAERHGADVVSVDCVEIDNLLNAKQKLNSRVDYRVSDLYKLPALQLGTFDYVFFLGVLYHVKHPLLALQIVCAFTRDVAIVESAVIDGPQYEAGKREEIPTLEFFETDELGGHFDNWFGPSVSCLMAMCRSVGFAYVELLSVTATTASVACFRRWPEPKGPFLESPPSLLAVVNNANLGINVSTDADDYLSWWFKSDLNLNREDLQFEVDGFGCHTVSLTRRDENGWSANTIVPPGIDKGWVNARMRTLQSSYGSSHRIAVDIVPEPVGDLILDAVQDGSTWTTGRVSPNSTHIVLWIRGLGEAADRANIAVLWNGVRLRIDFVGVPDTNNVWQVNAVLPTPRTGNEAEVTIRYGGATSNSLRVDY